MKQDMEHSPSEEFETATEAPAGVGPQLRAARERKGLSIEQVAAQTRIPQHQIEAIEAGEFSRLAGRTYAIGFARNLAKVVDLDQNDVAAMVRHEMDIEDDVRGPVGKRFEPGDSDRAPSGGLVWFSIFAVILLVVGLFFTARLVFAPAAELPSLVEQERAEQAALAAAQGQQEAQEAAAPSGPVVFTATEDGIWVRFYTADGNRLMEKELAQGESYTVPADAVGPQLWTGRPDALAITIGGRSVPMLAEDDQVMRDVPVTAEALLARGQEEVASATSEPTPQTATTATATAATTTAPATSAAPAPSPSASRSTAPSPTPSASATAAAAAQPAPSPSPSASAVPSAVIDALNPDDPLDPDNIPGAGAN